MQPETSTQEAEGVHAGRGSEEAWKELRGMEGALLRACSRSWVPRRSRPCGARMRHARRPRMYPGIIYYRLYLSINYHQAYMYEYHVYRTAQYLGTALHRVHGTRTGTVLLRL